MKLYTLDNQFIEETDVWSHNFTGIVEFPDGKKQWRVEGKLHRIDGPAHEGADGTKVWYVEGKVHRLDGPACEWSNGTKKWFVEGKYHRLDGPAIEGADGTKSWYIDDKRVTEEQCKLLYAIMKLKGIL